MAILIRKLNDTCHRALSAAAILCRQKNNHCVELSHFLIHLLNDPTSDIETILRIYEMDIRLIIAQLSAAIERLPDGNYAPCPYSKHIFMLLERAWLISSLDFDEPSIRSGAILLALIDDDPLRGISLENCPLLLRIPRHRLRQEITTLLSQSREMLQQHDAVTDMHTVLKTRDDTITVKTTSESL